ncbi:molybdate ABC transporter substrate-binding protein [Roseobacter weihaiensis]|uniref:molybdate ABC transporter substrate-binding protein n=1 Tax=Roseobacter weihaiensis TaxID=2763262 RepID=UPI001D0A822B|nr:molybdate ABC transporter substrate-binding protein [Roseobacter sp. H9]
MRFWSPLKQLLLAVPITLCLAVSAGAGQLTVFAAASLKEAVDDIARQFTQSTGYRVVTSYAGSSTLARQIEYGAPADVFISANADWMDRLEVAGLIDPATRFDLVGNRLVLIAPANAAPVALTSSLDLAGLLQGGKLAMALTEAVPAGIYGKAALENLGLWSEVEADVVETDNVRMALALVALRAAPLGVVYATDAAAEPKVTVRGVFPQETHPEIVYPAAKTQQATEPQATAFLDYLRSDTADKVFESYGFLVDAE